ncbi:MAG: nucleoside-diphosphate kinase [bacterium]
MKERTMVNIYSEALERSITGAILSMIRFMAEEDKPLTFIGADIYRLTKELASDFVKTLRCQKTKKEQEVQDAFKERLLDENSFAKSKYNVRRVFNLVIEGEDVIKRINRLLGDIRHRNGTTILGKFGFFHKEGNKIIAEFPVSCPSYKDEAEAQIDLFWNKYKYLGGPVNGAIKYSNPKDVDESVVIIKPNAFDKPYDPRIGDVIDILSRTGMFIISAKIQMPSREQMEEFYAPHRGKPFFEELINFMSGKRSLALLYEGIGARKKIREVALSIIRDNYSDSLTENTIHTSDNLEDFIREKKAIDFKTNVLLPSRPI